MMHGLNDGDLNKYNKMKKIKFSIILYFLLFSSGCISQKISSCRYGNIVRYGNVVYYSIDSLLTGELKGSNLLYSKDYSNRFFDLITLNDSINIIIDGSPVLFFHPQIDVPRNYQEILFYSNRLFVEENITIKHLKLISIQPSFIEAEARMRVRGPSGKIEKVTKIITIPVSEINGVFLGSSKTSRNTMYIMSGAGGIIFLTILLLR